MAVAGDVAGLWANTDIAIQATTVVIKGIKVFMIGIVPVMGNNWQVTITPAYGRFAAFERDDLSGALSLNKN